MKTGLYSREVGMPRGQEFKNSRSQNSGVAGVPEGPGRVGKEFRAFRIRFKLRILFFPGPHAFTA